MNRRLLLVGFGAAALATCSAVVVIACDQNQKNTAASNASTSATCTAAQAANCTAAQAAACKAKTTSATAATAAAAGCPAYSGATAASGSCSAHGASAVTASSAGSCAHGASASNGCSAHGTAATAASGTSCGGKGMGAMAMSGTMVHNNCDACSDMNTCETALRAAQSQYQIVPLKNGVMYVYTADGAKNIQAVQAAISRRTDRLNQLANANNVSLCPDCKVLRGAMASGKLNREVIRIEGGCLSLVTSNDPTVVAKLYAIAGLPAPKGVKS